MVDIFTPEKRSKIMSSIHGKNTSIELRLRKALWKDGIRGYRVAMKLPGRPDIAFPKYKVAVFCDGDFWHGYNFEEWKGRLSQHWLKKIQKNIERDKENNSKLEDDGWTVFHFWEWEILGDIEKCKRNLVSVLLDKKCEK